MIAAQRYNNPGDISLPVTGWTGGGYIVGLPDQPGYACFPTMAIGYAAFKFRLGLFIQGGRNTIRLIGARYAIDPHWPIAVASLAGIGIDATISTSNTGQMDALASAIIKQETGMSISQLMATSIPITHSQLATPTIAPTTTVATTATQPTAKAAPKPGEIMPTIFALPTIVHWIVALLPGIPDDVAIVEAELKELASTDDGVTKLKAALSFAQTMATKIEAAITGAAS